MKSFKALKLSTLVLALIVANLTGCGGGGGDTGQVTATATGVSAKVIPSSASQKFVPDELLIQFFAGVSKEKSDDVLRGHGATEVDENVPIRVKRIKVPEQALEQVQAALAKNPHVRFVEKNFIAQAASVPNDPSFPSQWHLPKISAPAGWDISIGNNAAAIAIIDSGVDPAHPDLMNKILPGYNFLNNTTDTHDVYGHGTKVAGVAAASTNNSLGVAGVAWQNAIVPLVVLDSTNYATYSNIGRAIIYAADKGIRVINVSIGGTSASSTLENAVTYAWGKGCLVFVSAGNSGTTAPEYPAACTKSIAVASTNSADAKSSFSQYGDWIEMSAPGESILTTVNGSGYGYVSGTSFSSPVAAGVAALILSITPNLTNQQVLQIMQQNADDLGTPGFDIYYGAGRVNAFRSITAAQQYTVPDDTTAPTVAVSSPASVVSGTVTIDAIASDAQGVVKVELYINGSLYADDVVGPYSFVWDSTQVVDGAYQLQAKAYDAAGNVGVSSVVTVTVRNSVDTVPPIVSVTSPADGASISGLKKVTITAYGSDNVGVSRVELYIDGVLKSSASNWSLSWTWSLLKVAVGQHVIMAKAYDSAGNSSSSSISVTR